MDCKAYLSYDDKTKIQMLHDHGTTLEIAKSLVRYHQDILLKNQLHNLFDERNLIEN